MNFLTPFGEDTEKTLSEKTLSEKTQKEGAGYMISSYTVLSLADSKLPGYCFRNHKQS